jgi:hypothetical protein
LCHSTCQSVTARVRTLKGDGCLKDVRTLAEDYNLSRSKSLLSIVKSVSTRAADGRICVYYVMDRPFGRPRASESENTCKNH